MDEVRLPLRSTDPSDDVHGFYASDAGRRYLRHAYIAYLDIAKAGQLIGKGYGETAFAGAIADEVSFDQKVENKRTEVALRRWAHVGQAEIWARDADKNLRVMRRLEQRLMLEPDIEQILSDRAVSIRSLDIAHAFGSFFVGGRYRASNGSLMHALAQMNGVYRVLSRVSATYPRRHQYDGNFWIFRRHDELPCVSVQEFSMSHRPGDITPSYQRRRAGFVILAENGALMRLMVDHANPAARWVESYKPDRKRMVTEDLTMSNPRPTDQYFLYSAISFEQNDEDMAFFTKKWIKNRICHPSKGRFIH